MNRNLCLCHFSYELQALNGNCSIYNNQMYFMCWTCPLTVNHLKYKTTRTFWKREPLTSSRRLKKKVSNFHCFLVLMRSEPSNAPKILHKALPQARGDTHKQAEAVWDQAILENSVCSSKVTEPGEHKQNRKLQLARAAPLTEFLEFWVSFWHLLDMFLTTLGLMVQLPSCCGPRILNLLEIFRKRKTWNI